MMAKVTSRLMIVVKKSTLAKKTNSLGSVAKQKAKNADRILRTTYGTSAEPNRPKCRVWNNHGHVTTLPMAFPDADILAVWFFAACRG